MNRTFGLSVLLVAPDCAVAGRCRGGLLEAQPAAHVTTAHDLDQAADFLFPQRGSGAAPCGLVHLVLIDVPAVDDSVIEFVRRVRSDAATRRIPVVIVSDCAGTSNIEEAFALGVNSVVTRPYDPQRRESLYRAIADYWLDLNESPTL